MTHIRVIKLVAIALLMLAAAGGQSPREELRPEAIRFGGLEWRIKDSGTRRVGPGPNRFSAQNVTVDQDGKLRLRAEKREGACVAAEVVASPSLGYGTYQFTVGSNLDELAKNLVLGLFVWDTTSDHAFHREMDVELGRWNREDNADAQFVIQPYTIPRNIVRFRLSRGLRGSVHTFTWAPDRASFRSEGINDSGLVLIKEHVFSRMIPEPGLEQARVNLWCMDSKGPGDGTAEVVLDNFLFTPLH